jgi:hypothetical protein
MKVIIIGKHALIIISRGLSDFHTDITNLKVEKSRLNRSKLNKSKIG